MSKSIDGNGIYMIGYIACGDCPDEYELRDKALNHALAIIEENHVKTGREHAVAARIDPQNRASGELFRRHGFEDYGVDPEATVGSSSVPKPECPAVSPEQDHII